MLTRCGIAIGPGGETLSPALYQRAYATLDMRGWTFERFDVPWGTIGEFVALEGPRLRGLAVTSPHKSDIQHYGDPDDDVQLSRTANTWVNHDGYATLHNTDIPGLRATFAELGLAPRRAVVWGAGATARSALIALAWTGCRDIALVARTLRVEIPPLVEYLGVDLEVVPWGEPAAGEVLVSTVPGEAQLVPRLDECLAVVGAVVQVAYAVPGVLRVEGKPCVDGRTMLLHQAVDQFELLTGRALPVPETRALLEAS